MSFVYENFRLSRLISLSIFALILSSASDASAYKEEQVRRTNKRVWSIIDGKLKFEKSSYSVERIRVSTPKPEQLRPSPEIKYERIPALKLQKLLLPSDNYEKRKYIGKESRRSYSTNSKGRPESFLENPNAVKKFCDIQVNTTFCIRNSESHNIYFGNTPKKHPRKKVFNDKNIFKKGQESKASVQQLIRQSDR